jgi:hypothetical protein
MASEPFQLDAGEIDRVVREVLKQLNEKQNRGHVAEKSKPKHEVAIVTKPAASASIELSLSNRLVTLADLSGRLEGIKQLVVPRGAVLTPAVRDQLRDARIAVSYRVGQKASLPQQAGLVLGVAETTCDSGALVAALRREETAIEQLARSGLASVVEELGDEVRKGGKLGLLITGAVDLALCLANRRSGVRAVQGAEPVGVRQAVETIGANLLVLDIAGKGLFQQLKIVREFVSPGPRACPAAWSQILG